MRKKSFTLVELLVVLIVIGLLAAFAIPQYLTAVEKTRVGKAKNNLGLIAQAEKMFRSERQQYCGVISAVGNAGFTIACVPPVGTITLDDYLELSALTQDADWRYGVAITGAGSGFIITATKVSGVAPYSTTTITMTDAGTCAGTHILRGADCGA